MYRQKSFAKIPDRIEPNNLVDIQTESYKNFLVLGAAAKNND